MRGSPRPSRRRFLGALGVSAAAVSLGARLALADARATRALGYGPLRKDPEGRLALPEGFRYRIVSRAGDPMDDGFVVPGLADGMHAFPAGAGKTVVVRNHELDPRSAQTAFAGSARSLTEAELARVYDTGAGRGAVTSFVYDTAAATLETQRLVLAGTLRNCSGGATPWGSWITCEEIVLRAGEAGAQRDHGYAFEVPAAARALVPAIPLTAMGRFYREAVAVDPASHVVFQTEDLEDGLLYRFVPAARGELARGGRLEALRIRDLPGVDTGNHRWNATRIPVGQRLDVDWVPLEDVTAPQDDLRHRGREKGAAVFARGEGMALEHDAREGGTCVWFMCTTGGRAGLGQLWCYRPHGEAGAGGRGGSAGTLELALEPNDIDLLNHGDNLALAPNGDLLVCEDNAVRQRVLGVTEQGGIYAIAENARRDSEFAGAAFSPDGTTLFVNIQAPGVTVAITGPWAERRAKAR